MDKPLCQEAPDMHDLTAIAIEELAPALEDVHPTIRPSPVLVRAGLEDAQTLFHHMNRSKGWWTNLATGEAIDPHDPNVFGAKIALIHSEASEALEAFRKNLQDDHLPHRRGVEVELADVLIRVFDLAGALGLDLAGAVMEKGAYNAQRADHTIEHRMGSNGKRI